MMSFVWGGLASLILLAVTTMKLYSDTAIAFDLMIGVVGAVSASYFLIGRYTGARMQQPA
jgi:hypothetical protein